MADYIGATPQENPLMGLLAERLKQAQQFAAKPFGYQNPPAEMLMNLLGIPAVQQTAERLAYGEPLTTGRGMTTQVRPEALEAAMTVAPVAGLLGRGVERGAMAVGHAGERYAEKVVPQIMERGGLPAQLLGDLSQGSVSRVVPKAKIDELTGLPLNSDGTVTLFHHTNKDAAEQIAKTGRLKSAGEPSVYLTTQRSTDTGYGDVAVPVRVKPSLLNLDDEFPSGRMDFSIDTGKPKGSIPVTVEKPSFTYPQEEALKLAQQRAALPKEQFGLGLPPDNTAQQRADAMFPFDVYHGTNADIQMMNTAGKGKTSGSGAFVNDNPLAAETYVNAVGGGNIIPMRMSKEGLLDVNAKGRNWADIETNTLAPKAGKKRYSLDEMELQKNDVTSTDELGMIAKDLLGLQGVNIKNVKDLGPNSHIFRAKEYLQNKYGIIPDETWSNVTGNQFQEARDYMDNLYKSQKSTVTAVQDPDLLRSQFAAFDPWRRTAAIAAAMGVAAPDLLAEEQKPKKKQSLLD